MKSSKSNQKRINEVIGTFCLLIGLFTLICLLFYHPSDVSFYTSHPNSAPRNVTGIVGVYLSHYLRFTFGLSSFAIPALFLFWACCYFLQKVPSKKWVELLGIIVSIISVSAIASLAVPQDWQISAGGVVGYLISAYFRQYVGMIGGIIIAGCFLALSLILATDFLIYPALSRFWGWAGQYFSNFSKWFKKFLPPKKQGLPPQRSKRIPGKEDEPKQEKVFVPPKVKKYGESEDAKEEQKKEDNKYEKALAILKAKREAAAKQETDFEGKETRPKKTADSVSDGKKKDEPKEDAPVSVSAPIPYQDYRLPGIDLLRARDSSEVKIEDDLQGNSKILEETLADFGVEVKVTAVEQGPVITRYELLPAPGMKVTRIVGLSDDLALALKATSIRFIAPIPGKSAIGIEIPNSTTALVTLRELIESKKYKSGKFNLPLILGKDTSGKPIVSDLEDMPHLLIAGTTGSGKTVCVNSIIAGLLYSKTPAELKFVMIDPKMVELSIYRDIPHMMTPVVTDPKKAAVTLQWVVNEMDKRYKILAASTTRNIEAFNLRDSKNTPKFAEEEIEIPERLPYIIVVIDELADLMMIAQDRVETAIMRLAQLSRAVGIHLILATQRPSVDVITGVIKANFPARISFKVASKVDSRTVIDAS